MPLLAFVACGPALPTLTLEPATLADAQLAQVYGVDFTSPNGTPPLSFSLTAGDLPPGLTLSTEGRLEGTPLTALTSHFTVQVVDSRGAKGSAELQLTVQQTALTVAPATLPHATRGVAYLAQLSASGGVGPFVFSLGAGMLPTGLELNSQGLIVGRPTMEGTSQFTVHVVDGEGRAIDEPYTLVVDAPSFSLGPATLPGANVGLDYAAQLEVTGGDGPYTFTLESGALPAGLSLGAEGALFGIPTAVGDATFVVKATDGNTNSATHSFTLSVTAPAFYLGPSGLPLARLGLPYSEPLEATGGQAPYDFKLVQGTLPAGFALAANGTLSGTAITLGTFYFTVTATDDAGASVTRAFALAIAQAQLTVTPDSVPSVTPSAMYSLQFSTTGGVGPYLYTVKQGQLPAGLALSAAGLLSGTTTASAMSSLFLLSVVDTAGNEFTDWYPLNVASALPSLDDVMLPDGTVGMAYVDTQLTVTGGQAPFTFRVTAGHTPSGVQLTTTGVLTGAPLASGVSTFTVAAFDRNTLVAHRTFTLTVH